MTHVNAIVVEPKLKSSCPDYPLSALGMGWKVRHKSDGWNKKRQDRIRDGMKRDQKNIPIKERK